jgi:ribosomal protein L15
MNQPPYFIAMPKKRVTRVSKAKMTGEGHITDALKKVANKENAMKVAKIIAKKVLDVALEQGKKKLLGEGPVKRKPVKRKPVKKRKAVKKNKK